MQVAAGDADRAGGRQRCAAHRRRAARLFCPPRVLLPENPAPGFAQLFLDELPACTPDVQKAFYSLLLERRLGEYPLPPGTWVVAAGNRAEDRALVRTISSALVNRVLILNVRIDVAEWLTWARANNVRPEILSFIEKKPDALLRPVPRESVPFSTPRAWTSLAGALDLAASAGILTDSIRRALALGRVTGDDARAFCAYCEQLASADERRQREEEQRRQEMAEQLDDEASAGLTVAEARLRLDQVFNAPEPTLAALGISTADFPISDPKRLQAICVTSPPAAHRCAVRAGALDENPKHQDAAQCQRVRPCGRQKRHRSRDGDE